MIEPKVRKLKTHYIVVNAEASDQFEEVHSEDEALQIAVNFCEAEQENYMVYKAIYAVKVPKGQSEVIKLK